MDENILKQAGLSEEQAITYEALLEKGPQKATPLSSWTGIKRGLIYKVLEQLENMGLVEKKGGTGTVAVFYPNHPSVLLDKMDRDKKNLDLAKEVVGAGIGALSSKYNLLAGKPNVRFFEGSDAIEKITSDYPKKDTEIRQWIDISIATKEIKNEFSKYLEERVKKGISKRMIVPNNTLSIEYVKKGSELTEFHIEKSATSIPTAIQVYDDTVSMLTLSDTKKIGFIIEDPAIAETMKNIFDEAWNKNKTIEPTS
ncbi:MAG: HTH-type transcriptional regulator, sugar sensing transcriptional regulator [Patescibacteria group bacterium]|nr:HTH-type transcriptional regulator, sugar sensing transcriptional regulator [Patescibacteria group bacterium]